MLSIESLIEKYKNDKELWRMLQSLDIITLNHSVRVCEICQVIEKELGFKDTELSEAALFHDVGKYFVSVMLLNKRGELSDLERALINLHSYLSYKVLRFYNKSDCMCKAVLFHHSFNPLMMGDEPIFYDEKTKRMSLILKTVDIYEALTTDRPYHRGISPGEALKIVVENEHDNETVEVLKRTCNQFE